MRQARWTEDSIGVVETSPGPLSEGWVRIKVAACGICGSDLHNYRGELPVTLGGTPGHEVVGTVLKGGSGLTDSLYAMEPRTVCGVCDYCTTGRRHLCEKVRFMGGSGISGGLSEFVDIPRYGLFQVDNEVPTLTAALAEPVAVCVRALNLARLDVNSRVLVLGAGTVGLIQGLLARDRCLEVAITARYPHQADIGKAYGLTVLDEDSVRDWAELASPDVVIETVGGTAKTLGQAVDACRPAGRIVVLGIFTAPPLFDPFKFLLRELDMQASLVYASARRGQEFGAAVSLLPRYAGELALLQTHQFPLSQIQDAFACAADKTNQAIKVTVVPDSPR